MPIVVQCKCGKKMKVRETSAGKRVKCVECGGPVKVPESAHNDDYGADSYDDGASSSAAYGSPPPRKKAATKKKKSAKKSSDGNSKLALMIVGGAVLGLALVGGALWALLGGGGSATPDAANVAEASDSPAADGGESANSSTPETDTASTIAATSPATDPATPADTSAAAATETPATPPPAATPVAMPTGEAANLWIVLSDFQEIPGGSGINKNYQISYRIAAGKPDPAQQYELYYGASMGSVMERYNVVPVLLQPTGTIQVPTGLGMSGNLRAYLGRKTGRQEWEPVSGEINPGGSPTSDRRPPTVAEAAGADAQGKLFALANPRFENARGGSNAFVVDFVLQQPVDSTKRYVLVIQGQGDPVRSDISISLMRTVQGKKDQLGVRTMGPDGFPAGPLTAYIEERIGIISREAPVIVSNSVTLQR